MCVITDENHIVISVSLIRGLDQYPENWHIYEYVPFNQLPFEGQIYKPV